MEASSAWITVRRVPMAAVLDRVPGKSHAEKARKIGVPRQIVWLWAQGKSRPSAKNARKLSKVTGIPAGDIMGKVIRESE